MAAGLTLDTGALIAADRGDRAFWSFWKRAISSDVDVTVPAPVLAQAWRGPRSARIASVVTACVIESLDGERAKAVGVLLGRSQTDDVVDATVVSGASQRGDDVLTSDPADIGRLAAHAPGLARILDLGAIGSV